MSEVVVVGVAEVVDFGHAVVGHAAVGLAVVGVIEVVDGLAVLTVVGAVAAEMGEVVFDGAAEVDRTVETAVETAYRLRRKVLWWIKRFGCG